MHVFVFLMVVQVPFFAHAGHRSHVPEDLSVQSCMTGDVDSIWLRLQRDFLGKPMYQANSRHYPCEPGLGFGEIQAHVHQVGAISKGNLQVTPRYPARGNPYNIFTQCFTFVDIKAVNDFDFGQKNVGDIVVFHGKPLTNKEHEACKPQVAK